MVNKTKKYMQKKNKKYNRIKSHRVLKTKKLTSREKRYCSCLMKVKGRGIRNPYPICTAAVYNKQGVKRDKVVPCTIHYDFSKYPLRILRPYAKDKKIKNYKTLKKGELIMELKKLQDKK